MEDTLTKGDRMSIRCVVGEALADQRRTDVFILHARSMSGDADAYRTETHEFDNSAQGLKELEERLALVLAVSRLTWNDGCDNVKVADAVRRCATERKLTTLTPDEAVEWFSDLMGRDSTTVDSAEQYDARLDHVWVTYVRPDHVEFSVFIHLGEQDGDAVLKNGIHRGRG